MIEFLGLTLAIFGGCLAIVAYFTIPFYLVVEAVRRKTSNGEIGALAGAVVIILQMSLLVAFLLMNVPVK